MARKTFKTIEADVDAGTHDDRLYNKAFEGFRASVRNRLLPLVRHETPILAAMQVIILLILFLLLLRRYFTCRSVFVHLLLINILFGQLI